MGSASRELGDGKARITGNRWTIARIRNAAGGRFGLIDAVHKLIKRSLPRVEQ